MKILLIPFLFIAAAMTANAHCGACGTDHKAHATESQPCCSDSGKCCSKKKACADKKDCATSKSCADKQACTVEGAAVAKVEMPKPKMSCCPKDM